MIGKNDFDFHSFCFSCVKVVFFSLSLFLFINQTFIFLVAGSKLFPSDMDAHILLLANDQYYSLYHIIIRFLIDELTFGASTKLAYGSVQVVLLLFSLLFTLSLVRRLFRSNSVKYDFLALSSLVVSMIIIDLDQFLYLGTGSGNPWHNPTQIISRPFALATFILMVTSFNNEVAQRKSNNNNVLFLYLIVSLVGVWLKPTFYISFYPSIAIFVLINTLLGNVSYKYLFSLGACSLISLIPLYFISKSVYSVSSSSVVLTFGSVWYQYTDSIIISVLKSSLFPLYVVLLNVLSKKRMSVELKLSAVNFIFGACVFFFLAETGERANAGNFGWTYLMSLFVFFVFSMRDFFESKFVSVRCYTIGILFFLLHLLSGLYYFCKLTLGYSYF